MGRWIGAVLLSTAGLGILQTPEVVSAHMKNVSQDVPNSQNMPKWSSAEQVVIRHLESQPGYKKNDLITQSQIEPIFNQLRLLGWTVADRRAIIRTVPSDKEFVVKTLSTKSGKKFMRRIAGYPDGYDRLYRLAALRGGQQLVTDLVRGRGGEEMIEYLTTSQGGKNMGKMLGQAPKGRNFNKPTGKLFTEKQFTERLKQSYDKAQKTQKTTGVK